MTHVPFKLDDTYGGLAKTQGLITGEADRLRLQFQIQDALVGVIKSDVRQIDIPLADVASVEFREAWFGFSNRLVIQVTRLDLLQSIPGIAQGRLVLGVDRHDRPAARAFAAELAGLGRAAKKLPAIQSSDRV